jgi:hypothetical protein
MASRVVEVVAGHHEEVKAPSTQLAATHVADVLAYGSTEGLERLREDPRIAQLGLDAAALDGLAGKRRQIVALARALT